MLRFDDLPVDLQQQVEVYASAARRYAEGERLLTFGYAVAGYGSYRVKATSRSSGADSSDPFFSTRIGGGLSYRLDGGYVFDGSLDYRYRNYDNAERRDDSDLRWNAALSRALGEGNLATGVRGRVSYRGDGNYRNDFGAYVRTVSLRRSWRTPRSRVAPLALRRLPRPALLPGRFLPEPHLALKVRVPVGPDGEFDDRQAELGTTVEDRDCGAVEGHRQIARVNPASVPAGDHVAPVPVGQAADHRDRGPSEQPGDGRHAVGRSRSNIDRTRRDRPLLGCDWHGRGTCQREQ